MSTLLMQQGQEQREEVFREEFGALGCGMDAVGLDGSGHGVDVRVEHGQQRDVIARGDLVIHEVELMNVGLAVVGRQGDAGEQHFGVRREQAGDDGLQIAFSDCEGQAAEAVVATELDDDDGGVHGEDERKSIDAVLGGVAADASVDDAVVVAARVEVMLKRGGPGLAGDESVASGDAVSVADYGWQFGGAGGERNERGREGQKQDEGDAAVHILKFSNGLGCGETA